MASLLCLCCWLWRFFIAFSSVSGLDFEHVNVCSNTGSKWTIKTPECRYFSASIVDFQQVFSHGKCWTHSSQDPQKVLFKKGKSLIFLTHFFVKPEKRLWRHLIRKKVLWKPIVVVFSFWDVIVFSFFE